jgi:hypothetical protein
LQENQHGRQVPDEYRPATHVLSADGGKYDVMVHSHVDSAFGINIQM